MAALPKTLDPNPYNKIWNVNFHQRNMFQYNEVLGNYGRFKTTIRHLKIREGCHLLKTGKKDIRGLLFEEYEEFLPRREGSLVEWVVISEAHDIDLVFSTNLRIPDIDYFFGYCWKCPEEKCIYEFKSKKNISNFTQHVLFANHEPPSLLCDNCGQKFKKQRDKERHLCDRFKDLQNPVDYTLANPGGYENAAMNRVDSTSLYLLASKFKIAVPDLYPPLFVPYYLRKEHIQWNEFCNPNGEDFLFNVLADLPEVTGENFICLDKEIKIKRENSFTVPIGTECTKPTSHFFICQNHPTDPKMFQVRLRYDPEVETDSPQLLDSCKDLKVYQRYTKDKGFPHSPHRYPRSERREKNKFFRPELMPEPYLRYLTGAKTKEFWIFNDICLNDGMVETKTFTIPVRVLIFYMRLRHRKTITEISIIYDYDNLYEIENQFYETLVIYFAHSNEIPRLFAKPDLTDEEKNNVFREIMEDTPSMMTRIADNLADPLGLNRKAVLLTIDSTLIPIEKSGDSEWQKQTFSYHKKRHGVLSTLIGTCRGDIIVWTDLACSLSPTHGDTILSGHLVNVDECLKEMELPEENGIANCLKSTDEFFVVLFADRGYSYAKKKNVGPNIHLLSKYVTETGGLFVTPNPLNPDDEETGGMILQKGEDGKFYMTAINDLIDPETQIGNHACIVGLCRWTIEASIGAAKQWKFLKMPVNINYLMPLGKSIVDRFNFHPKYQYVTKLTLIAGCIYDMYMKNHRPFLIKYLDDVGQGKIYRQVKNNLNRVNSFTLFTEIDYSFDLTQPPRPSNHEDWVKVKISELDSVRDQFPFWIPEMSEQECASLHTFSAGKFKQQNAKKYIALCRKLELAQRRADGLLPKGDYQKMMHDFPEDLEIYIRHVDHPGDDYLNKVEELGLHPWDLQNGCLIITTRIPSSNKSILSDGNLRDVTIILTKDDQEVLGFYGPLKKIIGWYCRSSKNSMDSCNRQLMSGSHVLALILMLFCRRWIGDKGRVVLDSWLSDTRQPVSEQPHPHFNIPYDRGDHASSSDDSGDSDDSSSNSSGGNASNQPGSSNSGQQPSPPASPRPPPPASPRPPPPSSPPRPPPQSPPASPPPSTSTSSNPFFGIPSTGSCRYRTRRGRRESMNLNLEDSINEVRVLFKSARFYNRYPNNRQAFFCWAIGAMVATCHVIKKDRNLVNAIHTFVDMNMGPTLIQMLLELVDNGDTTPKLPLYFVEKLIEECDLIQVNDPRLRALNASGSGELSILSEDQEGQLFFELVTNLEAFTFLTFGTCMKSNYSILKCPACGKTVTEGQTSLETWSPIDMAPMVYLQLPQRGETLESLIKADFEEVQGVVVNCRDKANCGAQSIGHKNITKILEVCNGAFIASVQRRDAQGGGRAFQTIEIGNDTIIIHEGSPQETKLKMVACLEHTVAGADQTVSSTGHYRVHLLEDGRIFTVDCEKPVRDGSPVDIKRSEIFIYMKID